MSIDERERKVEYRWVKERERESKADKSKEERERERIIKRKEIPSLSWRAIKLDLKCATSTVALLHVMTRSG